MISLPTFSIPVHSLIDINLLWESTRQTPRATEPCSERV